MAEHSNAHKGSLATLASSTTSYFKETLPTVHWRRQERQHSTGSGIKPSRWMRAKNHMRRMWWAWFLVIIAILAVMLPCLFLLIIPAVIRMYIDNASLPVLAGSIEAVSANQVRMGLTSQVLGPSVFTVHLDPFDLNLTSLDDVCNGSTSTSCNEPTTFLSLKVPAQTIQGPSKMIIDAQTVDVQSHTELSKFLVRAFASTEGSVRVRGTTTAHLGLLSARVAFNKEVHFGGLKSLEGTNVTSTESVVPFEENGTNIKGTLTIVNVSPFTFFLGNMTCTLVGMMEPGLLDGYIGNSTVRNLVLQPGSQTVEYQGQLDTNMIGASMFELTSNVDVMESRLVPIAFRGNRAIVNGEHIGYLDEVLGKVDVSAKVPLQVGTEVMWYSMSKPQMSYTFV